MNQEHEDNLTREQVEPIAEIVEARKKMQDNARKQHELRKLTIERKELELRVNIEREKAKIEKLKLEMEKPRIKKEWCTDCNQWEDQYGNPLK